MAELPRDGALAAAPPLNYPVGASSMLGALLIMLWLTAALTIGLSLSAEPSLSWRSAVLCLSLVCAGCAAIAGWRALPRGRIDWDGQVWRWQVPSSDLAGQLQVLLDAQRFMLLRWEPVSDEGRRGVWLMLERRAAPVSWTALRRAVYSRPKTS